MKRLLSGTVACLGFLTAVSAQAVTPVAPGAANLAQSQIKNGPWTLAMGAAITGVATSTTNPYSGYCNNPDTASPILNVNVGTNLMQPYYFPHTRKLGNYIQGFFDYRPRNADEATVAAISADGGRTWMFNQKAQELTTDCPWSSTDQNNTYVNLNNSGTQWLNTSDTAFPSVATTYSDATYADNGFGHPYVTTVNGNQFLYNLDRSDNSIDVEGLVVHSFTPTLARPLGSVPAMRDVPQNTTGLLNPDAILGEFPGVNPGETTVLYVRKQLNADTTLLQSNQICGSTPSFAVSPGKAANHDVTTLHIATTSDGINFTDLGPVSGLNDSTTTSYHGIRYLGSGSVFPLADGRFGLVFGAGNCLDGDSDGFHFVGYAETTTVGDLFHWTVVNGLDNPIASTTAVTGPDPTNNNATTTWPANTPLLPYQPWFAGRAYGATATYVSPTQVTVVFAGYNTPQPKNNLGNYRSIGRFDLIFPTNYVAPF